MKVIGFCFARQQLFLNGGSTLQNLLGLLCLSRLFVYQAAATQKSTCKFGYLTLPLSSISINPDNTATVTGT
ncbi:hypothetical protein BO82DRAFT_358676 [Aspergillus uvarum CBS 121591]|uniref:Uncharacterized protein n=1 Tax=Aspergillus uvarum CBS 121591 TaxID=1448315 RepID=A0A319BXF4_9EURO|nr:hypothetical protein BO82DRAFT_358676 [Aspergillus uvarum CBS 121591]PYH76931.1 hypothetical protein BO82DRAFT_358676 [Aspergillus uvarum CBS 121591]